MSDSSLKIVGAPGSPYSRKLRAVLRFRRIPHRWIIRNSPEDVDIPRAPVALMPLLVFPGEGDAPESAEIDSTPLIRRLEAAFPGRSVIPSDPALAFIDALIEDYADEWLTKAMFHYRWAFEPDIAQASAILPRWFRTDAPEDQAPDVSVFAEDGQRSLRERLDEPERTRVAERVRPAGEVGAPEPDDVTACQHEDCAGDLVHVSHRAA